ncbi:MAG: YdcH family protein [Phenylobacterium sp.]|jgi:hypothetical protein|uniref:YdcH family protein n=1 Tax=Phenylobacterium sp. TaxID=1871053 RepID=UPI0037CB60FB
MNPSRIWRLRNHHRWLEDRIRQEQRRPQPDALTVAELKRQKLMVKDELFLAEAGLASARTTSYA